MTTHLNVKTNLNKSINYLYPSIQLWIKSIEKIKELIETEMKLKKFLELKKILLTKMLMNYIEKSMKSKTHIHKVSKLKKLIKALML